MGYNKNKSANLGSCSCSLIFFFGKKQHQHGERIIISINEMRYLLYYNDCHFACRFNSLPGEKSQASAKSENQIFFCYSPPHSNIVRVDGAFLEVLA
jgi:hypothetical protein